MKSGFWVRFSGDAAIGMEKRVVVLGFVLFFDALRVGYFPVRGAAVSCAEAIRRCCSTALAQAYGYGEGSWAVVALRVRTAAKSSSWQEVLVRSFQRKIRSVAR